MKIAKSAPEVDMCEPTEVFNVDYFFNKGLLYIHVNDVCFYEVGRLEPQVKLEQDVGESKASMDVEEMKVEVSVMDKELGEFRKVMGVMRKELGDARKEMAGMRTELSGVMEEMQALKGRVTVMVGKSSMQNDQMAEAVQLMMMITKWLKENFAEPQTKLPAGPSHMPT